MRGTDEKRDQRAAVFGLWAAWAIGMIITVALYYFGVI